MPLDWLIAVVLSCFEPLGPQFRPARPEDFENQSE
jgi:hypothetical protein